MTRKSRTVAVVLGLMAVTSLALVYTVDVTLEDQPGVRMELPATVGGWIGHELLFCHEPACKKEFRKDEIAGDDKTKCPACGAVLHPMSKEEYEQLPKDTQFVKSLYQNPAGDQLYVSIVLTGRERESIHRPERCLKGQGHTIVSIAQTPVPMPGRAPLDVTMMLNERSISLPQGSYTYYSFYAYWFVGQNRETPSHLMRMFWLAWDRVVHSVAHKWAYVAVSGRREPGSEKYRDMLADFLPDLHRAIVLADGAAPVAPSAKPVTPPAVPKPAAPADAAAGR